MLQLEWLCGVKENGKIRVGYWSQRKRRKVRCYSLNGCVVLRKMVKLGLGIGRKENVGKLDVTA